MSRGSLYQNFSRKLLEHKEISTDLGEVYPNILNLITNEKEAVDDYDNMLIALSKLAQNGHVRGMIEAITEIKNDELTHIKKLQLLYEGKVEEANKLD